MMRPSSMPSFVVCKTLSKTQTRKCSLHLLALSLCVRHAPSAFMLFLALASSSSLAFVSPLKSLNKADSQLQSENAGLKEEAERAVRLRQEERTGRIKAERVSCVCEIMLKLAKSALHSSAHKHKHKHKHKHR
jgi:hypothetical protein